MPNMADITVKNAANVDVVYVAASASAGDNVAAVWRANALSPYIAYRPEFRALTRDNGKKNGRICKFTFKFPVTGTNTTTGLPFLVAMSPWEISGTIPTNIDASVGKDAFTQLGNLIASALMRAVAETGTAPS